MNKIVTGTLAAALSASFLAMDMLPAEAAPAYVPQSPTMSTDIQQVDYKPWLKRRNFGRNVIRQDFSRSNDAVYWNGHRGSRHYRHGYRRHGDFWFPLAAFATGALITGAIVNDRPPAYSGNAHVQWCYDHYRSYRSYDNTFQPNYGPRKQCVSPY